MLELTQEEVIFLCRAKAILKFSDENPVLEIAVDRNSDESVVQGVMKLGEKIIEALPAAGAKPDDKPPWMDVDNNTEFFH